MLCVFFCHFPFLGELLVCCRMVFICVKYHILFILSPASGPLPHFHCPFCFYNPAALNIPERAFEFLQWGKPGRVITESSSRFPRES